MILSCNNISKSFGTDIIIKDCNFHIEANEKAAVIGNNGTGKSTLLKIIAGDLEADSGEVTIGKNKTIGYLAQHQSVEGTNTIYEEMLEAKKDIIEMENRLLQMEKSMHECSGSGLDALMDKYNVLSHQFELQNGYAYKSEITGVIKGLGFAEDEFDKKISALSGGQKTRVALGKLLLTKPDIIMLDEPTNHLDMSSITWLENFLSNYNGAVLIVAHDRYFLDKIVTKIIKLENSTVCVYMGNYTEYANKEARLMEAKLNLYIKQQKEIKHQEEVIAKLRSFKQEKFYKRAESREKLLDSMDRIENPKFYRHKISIELNPQVVSGNDVLKVENLAKSFGSNMLFDNINFEIRRGEKVAIIGDNGTGKTTMLKIINGIIDADCGEIQYGSKINIGYYDQEQQNLDNENTLFDEIGNAYPDMTNTEIRNVLAAFLFTDDDVFKYIKDLSGGERGRISLAKLMLSKANFIILDEPTNHLDIESKEILENAINNYTGTVLYVSHDRYFINKTATRILELTNRAVVNYLGDYDYYLEKRDELTRVYAPVSESAKVKSEKQSAAKTEWLSRKEEQAKLRKLQNAIKRTEAEIENLEEKSSRLNDELSDPANASNAAKLMEITKEQNDINSKLESLYKQWEEYMS